MGSPALGDQRECWGARSGETRGPEGDTLEERESPGETNLKSPSRTERPRVHARTRHASAIDGGLTRFLPLAPPPSAASSAGGAFPRVVLGVHACGAPLDPAGAGPAFPLPRGSGSAVTQNCPAPAPAGRGRRRQMSPVLSGEREGKQHPLGAEDSRPSVLWLVSASGAAVGAVFSVWGSLCVPLRSCPLPAPTPQLPRASLGDLPAFGPTLSTLGSREGRSGPN